MTSSNKKPILLLVGVLVLLGVAVFFLTRSRSSSDDLVGYYFYDLNTGSLYPQPYNVDAPAKAPSGGDGVYAAVYACHSCDDPDDRFIAYLSKRSEVYHEAKAAGRELTSQEALGSTLYRAVEGGQWFVEQNPAAAALFASVETHCPAGQTAVVCRP